ncbi:MAG: nodulation protein NfeD [Chthoniobacter sp.]|nr:nodulation protein NfeD [Chthoniobacter sp.]
MKCRLLLSAAFLVFLLVAVGRGESVALIRIDGAIGPATADYIGRGIREADRQQAQCLIIQLDTPGGLLESTKTIVQQLLASPIPTVVYVAPSGATAASAGCFITLASDVAAMAPTTTIGAAHPVELGGGGATEAKPDDTMKQKLENYAVSYIETIATKRKRNVEWAKSSVKESASITAEKALELKVVEIIAKDADDLLRQLDGREINGRKLHTAGAAIVEIKMSASEFVFQKLWRPEVMFLLMLIAMYGIIGELSNPGVILPGVLGAIALVLALYMSAILPVNTAGLVLVMLALGLFAIDVFAPSHGVLTFGGIAAFFIGSLLLFDQNDPAFRLSLGYIIPATLLTAGFFLFVVGKGLRAQHLPARVGRESMLGRTAQAITPVDSRGGKVLFDGEYWRAVSDTPVAPGAQVEITAIEGLTVQVKHSEMQPMNPPTP